MSATVLIDALIGAGCAHAVLSPGSRSTPLALALDRAAREGRVALSVVLDERSAAFLALGAARASGKAAIVVATSGSAGAHFLPAAIEASESGVPLVIVTADRPPELHGVGAPQTTPQAALFGVHAKAHYTLPVPSDAVSPRAYASFALRAVERAIEGKPGPVHIDAPFREPLWAPGEAPIAIAPVSLTVGRARLSPTEIGALADELLPRGVIVAGPLEGELATPRGARAVLGLAERLGWPVIADAASNLRAGGHPAVITRGDAISRSRSADAALAPELVLKLGRAPSSKAIHEWLGRAARDRVIVLGDLVDHGHLARRWISASPLEVLEDLAAGALPSPSRGWLAAWQQAERVAAEVLSAPSETLWEGQAARAIAAALPAGALVHLGSGMPVRDFDACSGPLPAGVRVFSSRGANGIDGTTSTALGELWATPGARMISVTGDLTALHDLSGLRAARGQPITMVVIDNGGGGIFDFLPIAQHAEAYQRCFRTPQDADFVAIAQAMGLEATVARDAASIARAIERPGLVHVPIDARHNVDTHRARWAECARAIDHHFSDHFEETQGDNT